MNWRKWNRFLHRDLGYFFFGMTIIYAVSGISINHLKDWNPNYSIETKEIRLEKDVSDELTKDEIIAILNLYDEAENYKKHYFPSDNELKIFLKNGSAFIDLTTGIGLIEKISRRPFFKQINFLHYNPVRAWTYFSDLFAVSLFLLAISGLFILKGKKGIKGRGAWLTVAGILIPIIFILLFH